MELAVSQIDVSLKFEEATRLILSSLKIYLRIYRKDRLKYQLDIATPCIRQLQNNNQGERNQTFSFSFTKKDLIVSKA